MTSGAGVLLVGIGNPLLRDEGVGVHVARALAEAAGTHDGRLPPGARVVDGGTLGLDLLPLLAGARAVVFVDAVELGLAPGSISVIRDGDVRSTVPTAHSAHELGLATLIETARFAGCLPPSVTIVGVQPARITVGLDLTPAVEAAVTRAADLARREAWASSRSRPDPEPS